MAGITPTGFDAKTFEQILADINAQQLSDISPILNQTATSTLGQFNGIFSEHLTQVWELAEDTYNSQYPDTATGAALDNVASITGVTRFEGQPSTIVGFCFLLDGVTLPTGSVANLAGDPNARFTLDAAINNPGPGDQFIPGNFTAELNGPTPVLVGTLSEITEPVTGWTSIGNVTPGVIGRNEETDNELRIRREQQFALQGSSTIEAIRSAIRLVTGVTSVTVRENTSDTFAQGLRPHSINIVASGSFNSQEMADAIFDVKAGGIETSGAQSTNHTDSQGIVTLVRWDVPTTVSLFIDIFLTFDANTYPADGNTLVQQAVEDYANGLTVGQDVLVTPLACAIIADVTGVTDIETGTGVLIGTVQGAGLAGNFTIGPASQAQTAVGQVRVFATVATP